MSTNKSIIPFEPGAQVIHTPSGVEAVVEADDGSAKVDIQYRGGLRQPVARESLTLKVSAQPHNVNPMVEMARYNAAKNRSGIDELIAMLDTTEKAKWFVERLGVTTKKEITPNRGGIKSIIRSHLKRKVVRGELKMDDVLPKYASVLSEYNEGK